MMVVYSAAAAGTASNIAAAIAAFARKPVFIFIPFRFASIADIVHFSKAQPISNDCRIVSLGLLP